MKTDDNQLGKLLPTLLLAVLLACLAQAASSPPSWTWARHLSSTGGGSHGEQGSGLVFDEQGAIYVAGRFAGTADFGGTSVESLGGNDVFLAKYTSAGSLVWVRTFGGTSDEWAFDLKRDAAGDLYLCGGYYGTASFGQFSFTSRGGRDIFVAKCDGEGNVLWARSAGGADDYDWARGLSLGPAGAVYIVGSLNGSVDFDSVTVPGLGSYDAFVAKYDNDGTIQWAKSAGGSGSDIAMRIASTPDGNVVVVGYFQGTGTFGSTQLTSNGGHDVFVAKYEAASGEVTWGRAYGASGDDYGEAIAVDPQGNIYVGGSYVDSVSFDDVRLMSAGGTDAFVAVLDASGQVLRAMSGGGAGNDGVSSLGVGSAGGFYAGGYFHDTASFGGQVLNHTNTYNIFLAKYAAGGEVEWAKAVPVRNGVWGQTGIVGVAPDGTVALTGSLVGADAIGVFDDQEFACVGGWDVFLASLDPPGIKLWEYTAVDQIRTAPAIAADGTIYFGSVGGKLYALYPDGRERWVFSSEGGEVCSSPSLGVDGTIYFGATRYFNTGTPGFYALNPDGSLRWKKNDVGNVSDFGSSAIGGDGTVYFGSEDQKLYAMHADGTQKWSLDLGDMVRRVTVGEEGTVYATTHAGKVHAVSPEGVKQWEYAAGWYAGGLSLGADGTLYFTSYDKKLHAISPGGTKKWEFETGYYVIAEPAVGPDGVIYFGSGDGKLYALNPDGTKRWEVVLGGLIHTSPALAADGTLYATAEEKTVFGISPEGVILWSFETGYNLQASPTIAPDGTVYLGALDRKLYALKGTEGPADSPWPMFGRNQAHTRRADQSTITLQTGTINDQAISASSRTVTVEAGQALTGSFTVLVHNAMGANAIALVGATPTWGEHPTSYWEVASWVGTGDTVQTVTLPAGLKAPVEPGTYHLVVGMAGRYNAAQVMSGTAADPSGAVDWVRGHNLADIPAADLETAGRQGWLPYVWWWPSSQTYAAEDLAITLVTIVVPSVPPGRSTVVLQTGMINGQAISASNRTVTVKVGETLSGSFGVLVYNAMGANAIAPVGATPTWGTHSSSYWTVNGWVPTGNSPQSVSLPTGLRAPAAPGLYQIVVGMAGRYNAAQVMSGTAADPSGAVDWIRGHNLADIPAADLETAAQQGWLPYEWWWPSTQTYVSDDLAITQIEIQVEEDAQVSPGAKLWEYTAVAQIRSAPTIAADGTIYFGSVGGKLYALYPDGRERWVFSSDGGEICSAPSLGADGTIYFGAIRYFDSGTPKYYALNPDGSVRWERGDVGGAGDYGSSAIGRDGTVYFGSDDQKLYAMHADGIQKWSLDLGDMVGRVTVGAEGTVYATTHAGKVHAVSPEGVKQWEYAAGSYAGGLSLGADGTLYFTSYDKKLHAINPDGTKKWEFETAYYVIAEPAIGPDGVIYFGSGDGKLYALNPDGSKRWDVMLGGLIHTSPALAADGTIYATAAERTVYGISPDGVIQWSFETGEWLQASPTIAPDGTVYVGAMDHKFYALKGTVGPADSPWPMFGRNQAHTRRADQSAPPGDRNTILLQTGTINDQAITASSRTATVEAGQALTGSFTVLVHNAMGANAIAPVGATPTWGEHPTSYWEVASWVGTGDTVQTVTLPAGLKAPAEPGIYHIVVGVAGRYNAAQVMSGTAADPSGAVDWVRGHNLAGIPAADLGTAAQQGWLPYVWWWPSSQTYAADDLAITLVTIVTTNVPTADRSTIVLQTGTINGQAVSANDRTVTVEAGQALIGSFSVSVHNAMGANAIAPVGATPNWGVPSATYWTVTGWAPTGGSTSTVELPLGLTAPSVPGTYYLAVGMSGRYSAAQVMSGTHADPSGIVDWVRGQNVARLPSNQLELAAAQGWLPYLWYWPSLQTYAAEDLAVTTVRIVVIPSTVNRSTITLQTGTINGQMVSASARTVTVEPGQALTGSFAVRVHNAMGANAIAPLAATPTWGEPSASYWCVNNWVPTGDTIHTVTLPEGLRAPITPGVYYLAVGMSGRYNCAQVVSGTHADPSGVVAWDKGHNVARQPADQLELAASQGWIPYEWWWPSTQTYANEDLALTAIRIHVPVQLTLDASAFGTSVLSVSTGGSEGSSYLLQWSADLTVWHDLGRVTSAGQVVRIIDNTTMPTAAKFYRLVLVEGK